MQVNDIWLELGYLLFQPGAKSRAYGREEQDAKAADPENFHSLVPIRDCGVALVIVHQYPHIQPGFRLRLPQLMQKGLHASVKRGVVFADMEDFHGLES